MKKLFSIAALALAFCSCEAQHQLNVTFTGIKGDSVNVITVSRDLRSTEKQERVAAPGGVVTYDVNDTKARAVMMVCPTGTDNPIRTRMYAVPGEQGTLVVDANGTGKWTGTKFYTELAELESITDPLAIKMGDIQNQFQSRVAAGEDSEKVTAELVPQYNELAAQIEKANIDFAKSHPSSNVSATLLMEIEDAEAIYNALTPEVKNGPFSEFVKMYEAQLAQEKARAEAAKLVGEGMEAPNFTLKDINGNDLSLTDLRGKYLVLDFWGSWCGWCIKGFPDMKKYYEKYSSKLEILGMDCNDTEAKWKDAVAKNELPWKHVYVPRNSDVPTKYAISGFPTKIILDPQGKIVKTIVGESPEFYTTLDNLFK